MRPITAGTLNLTQDCNLRCPYCFTHGKAKKAMNLETGKRCIDFLLKNSQTANINQLPNKMRKSNVTFWGGEPLMEWELLKDLVLYGENTEYKDVVVTFDMTTNGTLLTEEKIPFLLEHQIGFMVSLDGTEETHDRFRRTVDGKGSHFTIMNNIERALLYFPQIKIRMSIYPDAVYRFYEDVRYLAQHGLLNIMFSPVYEMDWNEEIFEVWKSEYFKVIDLINYMKGKGVNIKIEHLNAYIRSGFQKYPCGAGRWYVGFEYDGSIFPCHRFAKSNDSRPWQDKEMCIGHVDSGIVKPDIVEKFINWNPECIACKGCIFIYCSPCAGGCYATNYDLTGSISKPFKAVCDYVRMQKEVSDYMKFTSVTDKKEIRVQG